MSKSDAPSSTETTTDRPGPEVVTIRATPRAEELVVLAARGDYYDGFVGEDAYADVVSGVQYKDRHLEAEKERIVETYEEYGISLDDGWEDDHDIELQARTRSMLEKLFKRSHWGPWEHPQITFGIKGISRSCMAQLTRHRHASFDVQSQRYVSFENKEPIVPQSLVDDTFSRETGAVELDQGDRNLLAMEYEDLVNGGFETYNLLTENGIPKEDARFALPLATPVNLTVSLSARSLLHIFNMRSKADSQWEIRAMMEQIDEQFQKWMPITAELWNENGPFRESP